MKTLIIIPSRLSATRLPGKPLLKINGLSMISHVFKKAEEANIGEVYVATEDQEIVDDVNQNGGQAILTEENHKTGTDRIHEAFKKLGKLDIELVMNLQGDEPLMDVEDIKNLHNQMIITKSNIGTLASNIIDEKLYDKEDVVKVITKESLSVSQFPEALNFARKTNISDPNIYHHLGIYCYRIESLKNFFSTCYISHCHQGNNINFLFSCFNGSCRSSSNRLNLNYITRFFRLFYMKYYL